MEKNQRKLVESHLSMVEIVVKEFLNRPPYRAYRKYQEDLYSVACIALIEASKRFEPKRGILFKTYASSHMRFLMLKEITKYALIKREEMPLDNQLLRNPLPQELTTTDTPTLMEEYETSASNLVEQYRPEDPIENEIYERCIIDGDGIKKTAKAIHKNHHKVKEIKKKLLEDLKNKIKGDK